MPLLEDVSTSERLKYMEQIAEQVRKVLAEASGALALNDAIYKTAHDMKISPQQVHYGLAFGLNEGYFTISSDGTRLVS